MLVLEGNREFNMSLVERILVRFTAMMMLSYYGKASAGKSGKHTSNL
jgi:hypothetical protein